LQKQVVFLVSREKNEILSLLAPTGEKSFGYLWKKNIMAIVWKRTFPTSMVVNTGKTVLHLKRSRGSEYMQMPKLENESSPK